MHVHLDPQGNALRVLVANGITGIREMYSGIPIATLGAWRARPENPRIAAAGFLDGPLMLTPVRLRPTPTRSEPRMKPGSRSTLLAASGADFLKVYNSLPREAYFAIAQESKRLGIPFAGHVPEAVSPAEASEAGQRSQEHLINILLACSTREEELRRQRIATMNDPAISGQERMLQLGFPDPQGLFDTYDEAKAAALFKTFVKNGTWHTPTLALLQSFLADKSARAADGLHAGSVARKQFDGWMARIARATGALQEAGWGHASRRGRISGRDRYGSQHIPCLPAAACMTSWNCWSNRDSRPWKPCKRPRATPRAISASCRTWARSSRVKFADLVLLDANPLDDIRNTRKISLVVLRGRILQ